MEQRTPTSSVIVKFQAMKVTLSFLLLTYLAVLTVLGSASSPIDNLTRDSVLECTNGRKFTVADSIYRKDLVCVKGVNEVKEAGETAGSGSSVKATVGADHKDCYSVSTLYVVKVAPKDVIAAEVKVLSTFGPTNDFAELAGRGQLPGPDNLEFYISTRYGPNLERVFDEFGNIFSVGTILGIGADMMDHFEVLHNHTPKQVWKTFDLSNICLTGKAGSKHKIYLAGFKAIGEPEDHSKQSQVPVKKGAPSKGNVDTRRSAATDIKALANALVYFSRNNHMSLRKFQEKNENPQLVGKALMEHWIGENGHLLCPFVEAAYGLKPGDFVDHKRLKDLLLQQPHSWDWETKKWVFI